MRASVLTLENFRGLAGRLRLELDPQLVVIAGGNGAGKTSVLDALALLLSGLPAFLSGRSVVWGGALDEGNISWGQPWCRIGLVVAAEGGENAGWSWSVGQSVPGQSPGPFDPTRSPLLQRLRATGAGEVELPLIQHIHSVSTRSGLRFRALDEELVGRLAGYVGAFDAEEHHASALERWFEQEENIENQEKIRRRNLNHTLPSLRSVRAALRRAVQSLQGFDYAEPRVLRSHGTTPGGAGSSRIVLERNGHALFLDQLSAGERRITFTVLDTARRMALLNPHLEDPSRTGGVLLLDEVDLHLHPRWQRQAVAALRAAFPRLQLITTTHSPLVLASVPSSSVVFLDGGRLVAGPHGTFGRSPDQLLETSMGVALRPDDVQERLNQLNSAVLDSPRKARRILKQLAQEIGPDDPELVRARAMLDLGEA